MTFVDVFAPFLFFRLPWPPADRDTMEMFNRQWAALRLAIVAVLRPITTKSRSLGAQVAAYRRHIQDYTDAAYQVSFSGDHCNHCRIPPHLVFRLQVQP